MKEFIEIIFGSMSFGAWCAYLLLALIGTLIYSWIEVDNRDISSVKTPKKFSFKFLALDNIKRYLLTVLLIFLQIRFFKEINGVDLTAYMAILLGFGADGIAGFSKKKIKVLQADREKLLNENNHG